MIRTLVLAASLAAGSMTAAQAALPSYPTPGNENLASYSFVKASDGDLVAYFVGATAGYTNSLGVLAGATDLGTGLSNADPLGTAFNYGFVSAGTALTFYIYVQNTGDTFYSDKSLNGDGLSHVFAAPYGGGDTIGVATFAPGTYVYVGFEDLFGGGDLDYDDINFVFENTRIAEAPEPGTLALFGLGLVGLGLSRRRRVN